MNNDISYNGGNISILGNNNDSFNDEFNNILCRYRALIGNFQSYEDSVFYENDTVFYNKNNVISCNDDIHSKDNEKNNNSIVHDFDDGIDEIFHRYNILIEDIHSHNDLTSYDNINNDSISDSLIGNILNSNDSVFYVNNDIFYSDGNNSILGNNNHSFNDDFNDLYYRYKTLIGGFQSFEESVCYDNDTVFYNNKNAILGNNAIHSNKDENGNDSIVNNINGSIDDFFHRYDILIEDIHTRNDNDGIFHQKGNHANIGNIDNSINNISNSINNISNRYKRLRGDIYSHNHSLSHDGSDIF